MLKKLRSNLRFRLREGRFGATKRLSKYSFGKDYSNGLSASQIRQLAKKMQNEYIFKITYGACLYLIRKDLTNKKKKAPKCDGFKKDGDRCQKRINHPSGHCQHHRS